MGQNNLVKTMREWVFSVYLINSFKLYYEGEAHEYPLFETGGGLKRFCQL